MVGFIERENYSLISLIIPQQKLLHCLNEILANWPYKAILFNCRGTVVSEHWLQKFLPIMNPEMEYLQYIVQDHDIDDFMRFCVTVNDLHLPGSGAVFSAPFTYFSTTAQSILCDHLGTQQTANHSHIQAKDVASETAYKTPATDEESAINFNGNLYAVFGLLQSGRTEQAIKAAMQAGSHGPLVYFVEGRGTRDRAGWLKITKKPYEEVVMLLVDAFDRKSVVDALVTAGNVGSLGSGVVFDMSIGNGLINLPTSVGVKQQRASNEQIATAIDQLMGNADWRNNSSLSALVDKSSANNQNPAAKHDNSLLSVLLPRKYANDFLDEVLMIGIPGANVIYTKLFEKDHVTQSQGFKVHQELVQIRMVVPETASDMYRITLEAYATRQKYDDVVIYQQDLSQVIRYQIKPKEQKAFMYRGGQLG